DGVRRKARRSPGSGERRLLFLQERVPSVSRQPHGLHPRAGAAGAPGRRRRTHELQAFRVLVPDGHAAGQNLSREPLEFRLRALGETPDVRVCITGGSGTLGHYLQRLLSEQKDVTVLSLLRLESPAPIAYPNIQT